MRREVWVSIRWYLIGSPLKAGICHPRHTEGKKRAPFLPEFETARVSLMIKRPFSKEVIGSVQVPHLSHLLPLTLLY